MSVGSIFSGIGKGLLFLWERNRSAKKSTVAIAIKALAKSTESLLHYLQHKSDAPVNSGDELWDKKRLQSYLLKKYGEDKRFTFHQSDSGQLALAISPYFLLPGHWLTQEELTSHIKAIIDSAQEIFIETLPNDKKAMAYNSLRDSRLLESIARDRSQTDMLAEIVRRLPPAAEAKTGVPGFRFVSREMIDRLNGIFVPPAEYRQLYTLLDKQRLVAIVGQPHVGKTTTAYMLAKQLSAEKHVKGIYEASDIDAIKSGDLASLSGSIVIFDDLFGEVEYDHIGANLKFIKILIEQNNYVIITSREYIFKEAKLKTKIADELPQLAPEMLQEGSYPTAELEKILINHVRYMKGIGELSEETEKQIHAHKAYILNALRFPHNIELFVKNCKAGSGGLIDIRGTIEISKRIGDLVQRIIVQGAEEEQRILLLCAMLKEIKISKLEHLLSVAGHKMERFRLTINSYHSLLIVDSEQQVLKYKHPSFREAVIEYFENNDVPTITSIAFRLLEAADSNFISLKPLQNFIFKMMKEMNVAALVPLYADKDINIKFNTLLFSALLSVDPSAAVEAYLNEPAKKHQIKSPVNNTSRKSVEQALDYVAHGLKSGTIKYSKRLEQLVFLLLTGSIDKTLDIYNALGLDDKEELQFKVRLLSPICQIRPERGLQELKSLVGSDIPGNIRVSAYAKLSVFHMNAEYVPAALQLVEQFRSAETNPYGIRKLDRAFQVLTRYQ